MNGTGLVIRKEKEVKLSLKIMKDSKARKVVFAEAQKDFVDFLFHILSQPLSTVVKLLSNEEMAGSLPALYKSVESLKADYFEQNVNKDTVLLPKLSITLPLLSLCHVPTSLTYFKCPYHNCASDRSGARCYDTCSYLMPEVKCTYIAPKRRTELPGFVKQTVPYMVMDNLEVMPMSTSLIKSLVKHFDSLVEEEVNFGLKEGLALLRASLETNDVLTTVFIGSKRRSRRQI